MQLELLCLQIARMSAYPTSVALMQRTPALLAADQQHVFACLKLQPLACYAEGTCRACLLSSICSGLAVPHACMMPFLLLSVQQQCSPLTVCTRVQELCPTLPDGTRIVINLSGRGDKDVQTVAKAMEGQQKEAVRYSD